ncbi:hypothetical protein LTR08_002673 [Meristemomyces frigidus]|nr:hypothetical protein LTR08_002673 [Meristemomyces frigidus]
MSAPTNAVLPAGSLVLVSGCNGFVGAEIANQLLASGYRVRGTVRDLQKSAWVQETFKKTYGAGRFELVKVDNMAEKGSLDEAVKGCAGVIHVASNISFSADANVVVNEAIAFTNSALESAAQEASVKRFVSTSSGVAVLQPGDRLNERFDITPDTWNEKAVKIAWAPPPYEADRGVWTYAASKVQAEQAVWKFMKERKPHFVANTVLTGLVEGAPVDVGKQGYPTSLGFFNALWHGNDAWKVMGPAYMVDAKDNALLHVAALLHPDYKQERVFAYAHVFNWTTTIAMLKKAYPEHQFPDPPENEGEDLTTVTARPRAEALLKWFGRPGWRPEEESLREICDTFA